MLRLAVMDTSVLVSALLNAGGQSRQALRLCLERRCESLMGHKLILEMEAVMAREALFRRSPVSAAERLTLFRAFLSVCRWVEVYYLWRPNLPDEDDNHLLELAVAGGAEFVVTKNTRDFERSELLFPQVQVVKPEEFVRRIG
jgi:putative PIN family toxin of toxin-antitoxin system